MSSVKHRGGCGGQRHTQSRLKKDPLHFLHAPSSSILCRWLRLASIWAEKLKSEEGDRQTGHWHSVQSVRFGPGSGSSRRDQRLRRAFIIRQQVSSVKTTSKETHTNMQCTRHAYLHTRKHGPLTSRSHMLRQPEREFTQTPNTLCRAAAELGACVTRHVSHSIPAARTGDSPKRPGAGQRRQPDPGLKEQRTRVSGRRHSLVL